MDLINWLAILFLLLGVIGLIVEVFVIPGFGSFGVAGILLSAWGVFLLAASPELIVKSLVWAILGTVLVAWGAFKLFKKLNLWRRISLEETQVPEEGYYSSDRSLIDHIGKNGKATTVLRPSGGIEVDGKLFNAISEGEFIEVGEAVEVIGAKSSELVVRKKRK